MLLYERMTFLLVTGTLGLFFLAMVLGAIGILCTLYPQLGKAVTKRLSETAALARKALVNAGVRTALLYRSALESRQIGALRIR